MPVFNELELIEREAMSTLNQAREIVVTCDEEYSQAGEFILGCKQLIAKIKDDFREPKRKADEAHKAITAMEKRTLEPVESAMKITANVALQYKQVQDQLAREEANRIAAEKRRAEEKARLKEAEMLEAAGKIEEAEAVISAPIEVPRQTKFFSPTPKVAGLSTTKKWKGRVVRVTAVKREFCLPDQQLINLAVQRRLHGIQDPSREQIKAIEDEIGGIEVFCDEVFAGRIKA